MNNRRNVVLLFSSVAGAAAQAARAAELLSLYKVRPRESGWTDERRRAAAARI